MKRTGARRGAFLPILSLAFMTMPAFGQEHTHDKEKGDVAQTAPARADPAVIARLVQQLGSTDFGTRDKASRELAALDEVPDALRASVKSPDLEVARRAQTAVGVITARVEEKWFQAMVRDLHKVELDHLVRRMVTDETFAGDKQWEIIQAIARAVTREANKLGERQFKVPDFDVKKMPHLLFKGETQGPTSIGGSVVLSAGPMPRVTSVHNCIVIVDGDFTGATGIDNSLLIVRGNVGRFTVVNRTIILATGNFEGATGCDNSFLQVNNYRVRFTVSRDSVLIKTLVKTTGQTNSRTLDVDRGPLQLLKFSPRKLDDQLVWGKEVNNLAVAIMPADKTDQFLVRWKNVGKEAFELPWGRLNLERFGEQRDDLLNHVFLKGPDGHLVAARKYPAAPARKAPLLGRSVVLGPGQTHEETIDLWTYLDRPVGDGRYQLSIGLEIPTGGRARDWELKSWSGGIQSNVLEVIFGK